MYKLKEIENPNFEDILINHIIPVETINGLYEGFYIDFLEERAKLIFKEIDKRKNNKRKTIKKHFIKLPEKILTLLKLFLQMVGNGGNTKKMMAPILI